LGFVCGLYAQEQEEVPDSDYVIREDDILSIKVRDEKEYTVEGRPVRMDGRITLPMLGEIYASGKTQKQLETEITDRLKLFVKDPIVQVVVDRVASYYVVLSGKIGKTGRHLIGSPNGGSPTTVLEVLAGAGGPLPTASVKNIIIVRKVNGQEVQFKFNYKDVLQGKNLQQNIILENRDWIMVP
jgi:polysaccharide export outer membrane protein